MKRIALICFALLLSLSLALPASAANGKVSYEKNAGNFIFEPGGKESPTDLFPNFKGVMPGDSLTQKITVKNDADDQVKVKIYLRSLGAKEGSEEFLSKLRLQVQKSEENEMAYMFDAAANEAADLENRVCLGTLYSGGEVNLDVILTVPVELENEFQSKIGYLDWEFTVEEFPVEEGDPTPPQTGDRTRIDLWIFGMILSLSVILIIVWKRKENKKAA